MPVFRQIKNVANGQVLKDLAAREMQESMIMSDIIHFQTGLNPLHSVFDVVALDKKEFCGIVRETAWEMQLCPGGVMKHTGRQAVYQ